MPITREQFESSYGLYNALYEFIGKSPDMAFSADELAEHFATDVDIVNRELELLVRDGRIISHPYNGINYYASRKSSVKVGASLSTPALGGHITQDLLIKAGFVVIFTTLIIAGVYYLLLS